MADRNANPRQETTMKTTKRAVEVEIRERLESTPDRPLWRAIVTTTRGYCYSCTFAGDRPSEEYVRQVWQDDRKAFDPWRS
jgi:hypothetical protein